jgi:fucose permease
VLIRSVPGLRHACSSKEVLAVPSLRQSSFAQSSFALACLAYLSVAVPSSALGLLWPSMRLSWHEPLSALGVLLIVGVTASVLASLGAGRLLSRLGAGPMVAAGSVAPAAALAVEAVAPFLWVFALGMVVFGLGFGALDTALNAHAAARFGPRQINWMHASYGLGATAGPLVVTALRTAHLGWRGTFGALAALQAVVAMALSLARRSWGQPAPEAEPDDGPEPSGPAGSAGPEEAAATAARRPVLAILVAAAFAAVECGIESGAGVWGYVYLTAGRGLSPELSGAAVSLYWATMFAGRAALGPLAERVGAARVLTGGVAGLIVGAALLTVPTPPGLPAATVPLTGLAVVGLAAAPIFPLLTLTTAERTGTTHATWVVSVQVAASAAGNAALPAAIGLIIGALTGAALGPSLLVLSVVLLGLYAWLTRGRPGQPKLRPSKD